MLLLPCPFCPWDLVIRALALLFLHVAIPSLRVWGCECVCGTPTEPGAYSIAVAEPLLSECESMGSSAGVYVRMRVHLCARMCVFVLCVCVESSVLEGWCSSRIIRVKNVPAE